MPGVACVVAGAQQSAPQRLDEEPSAIVGVWKSLAGGSYRDLVVLGLRRHGVVAT